MKRIGKMTVCILLTVCIVVNTTYSAYSMEIAGTVITAELLRNIFLGIGGVATIAGAAGHVKEEFDKAFEEAAGEYKPNDPKDPRNQFEEILKKIKQGMRQVEIPDELWSCVLDVLGKAKEENDSASSGAPPTALDGLVTGSVVENSVKHTSYDFRNGYTWMNATLSDSCYVFLSAVTNSRGDTEYYYVVLTMDENAGVASDSNFSKLKSPSDTSPLKWSGYTYYNLGGMNSSLPLTLATGVDFFSFRKFNNDDYIDCMLGNVPSDVIDLRSASKETTFNMSDYMKDALSKFNPDNYDIVNDNTSYVENNYMTNNRVIDIPDDFEELLKKLNDNTISLEEFLKNFNVTPVFKTEDTNGDDKIDSHDKVTNNSRDKNGVPATVNNNNISAKFNLAPYTYTQLRFYFPFCLPWDFYAFFVILCEEPKAPVFKWTVPLSIFGGDLEDYDFKVDLSPFDDAAKTCRQLMLFCFCVGLIFATREFI